MMIFVNDAYKAEKIYTGFRDGLIKLLSPICTHLMSELWEMTGHDSCLATEAWPTYDEAKLQDSEITYAVSVNGKLRDTILVNVEATKDEVTEAALSSAKVKNFTEGHEIVKIIVVPKKIVNIVIK